MDDDDLGLAVLDCVAPFMLPEDCRQPDQSCEVRREMQDDFEAIHISGSRGCVIKVHLGRA